MNKLLFLYTVILGFYGSAQEFEVPTKKNPYYDILEWKGYGGLLLSKDPNGNTKQINITLVGNDKTSVWDQKFNPKTTDFYFISSENARYVYFLDNLELENGKAYFSQLNSAGNVKSTSVAIGTAIKKLGNYDYNKLELIDVVVTDKALVHHFRYEDKKDKSIREFATFTTHHNFLCYAVELGAVKTDALKDNKYGQWNYVGFTGDKVFFAVRDYVSKSRGWSVKQYSSKGKELEGTFIKAPKDLLTIENIGFGTTGKHYLKDKTTTETGLLTQINGKFYLMGGQRRDAGAELILFEWKEEEWNEVNSINLNYFIEKKNLKLGIFPMNEGLGYHLDHNGYNKVSMVRFDGRENPAHNEFSDRTVANPSSVFYPKKKAEFIVRLTDKILAFDTSQLGKGGSVIFEHRAKK
ncbi:MAG: hypothetical protein MK066_02500 [Crocinitomicaceae bacterium]|nr:hypothetical protein [Crocinitomicaceae bacterium]